MKGKLITVGSKVIVHKPQDSEAWMPSMDQFDGMETRVVGISGVGRKPNGEVTVTNKHFQLDGCVSELGVPFNFCADWLDKVE